MEDIDYKSMFTFSADIASRPTRQSSDPMNIVTPSARLEVRRNFFTVRVCDPWNNIPLDIRLSPTLNAFKNSYDEWSKACQLD